MNSSDQTSPVFLARWPFVWLCLLILSFFYERPLVDLTGMHRANPRLFDLVLLVGLFTVWPGVARNPVRHIALTTWTLIVGWFCICSLIWSFCLLPWDVARFSLFYAVKYIEGLLAIHIAMRVPLTDARKRRLMWVIVAGGAFVGLYCIPQYVFGWNVIQLTEEKDLSIQTGALTGPLGVTYVHLAMVSSLAFSVTLSLWASARRRRGQLWLLGLLVLVGWPLLFCKSRTALGMMVVSVGMLALFFPRVRGWLVGAAVGVVFLSLALGRSPVRLLDLEGNRTIQRLVYLEDTKHSIFNRVVKSWQIDLSQYTSEGAFVPLIGAGFMVAPVYPFGSAGSPFYRIGYGVHNSYLFPLEQGGGGAVLLFCLFLLQIAKLLRERMRSSESAERLLAYAAGAFGVAMLFAGPAGQNFWLIGITENANTFVVLVFLLASSVLTSRREARLVN